MTILNRMARRRSALPVISEPMLDPKRLEALLEDESRRRNSTNSMHLVGSSYFKPRSAFAKPK